MDLAHSETSTSEMTEGLAMIFAEPSQPNDACVIRLANRGRAFGPVDGLVFFFSRAQERGGRFAGKCPAISRETLVSITVCAIGCLNDVHQQMVGCFASGTLAGQSGKYEWRDSP
jgi:hypothetical protein